MNLKRDGKIDGTPSRISSKLGLSLFLASLLIPGSASVAWSQSGYSTGTVRGTVTDAQGALVPNAKITITETAKGTVRTVKTNAEGVYQAPSLDPGTYKIEVVVQGFERLVAAQWPVAVGQTVEYDAHLRVGGANEVVEVQGNVTPVIDTTQAQQANTIDTRQEVNLPNLSRNYAATIYTVPGVTDSSAPQAQDAAIGTGYQASGFSIGGGNGRSNLFTIDGGENDAGSGAQRDPHVPQDSVEEFQVNRNGFNAEFGFTVGAAINVVTKSGTNQFHGNAFGYFHDHSTDAVNYFNSFGPTAGTKPYEQSAIFGGSVGGRIKKDKLFFFTSYERQKLDSAVTVNLVNTAQAQGLNLQTNGFTGSSCPAPITQLCYLTQLAQTGGPTLGPLAQGFIGSSTFTPINDPLYNALVSPNSGTFDGNANSGAPQAAPNQNGRYNNWVSRLDYQPNQANSFVLRFGFSRETNNVTGAGGVPRYTSVNYVASDQTITASWNHVFSPNLVNTVRVQVVPQYDVTSNAPHGGAEFDLGSLGIVGTPFDFPYNQKQNQYQFDDDVALTKGAHNMKFGFSYRPVQYSIYQAFLFGGEYEYFDGEIPIIELAATNPAVQTQLAIFNLTHGYALTGPASTNLSASQLYVVGLPLAVLQGTGNGQYNATTNPAGLYAQDSWKATQRLTLNYGGRLDIDPEPNGYPTSYFGSPRVGLAWDPYGNGKTVVRASGGLFTAPLPFIVPFTSTNLNGDGQHIYANALTAPGSIPELFGVGTAERSLATTANPNPGLTTGQYAAVVGHPITAPGPSQQGGAFFSVASNFKSQYSIQGSASVAQQLAPSLSLEISYLYNSGVHIEEIQEGNFIQNTAVPVDPFVGPQYIPKPGSTFGTPNAQIVQNDETTSAGHSTYNALTASLSKHYGHGLEFQVNYTFSKAIDNTSDYSSQSTPLRPGLLNLDRAVSDFNIKNSFVASAVYTSPAYHSGQRWASLLYSNFILAPIVSLRDGVPFTSLIPALANLNGTGGAHPGEARPFSEGRNQGIGPGYKDFDLRLSRDIPLKQDSTFRLQAVAQASNVLNHTNFTSVQNIFPDTSTTNAAGLTNSAPVPTPEGTVDLLNGPFNYKGFRPNGPAQLTDPLAFKTAGIPRQISFGLELAF